LRSSPVSVWTGNVMIAWGGEINNPTVDLTGGRYDPLIDAWTPTSTTNAPVTGSGRTVVWTGTEMVVWGGGDASHATTNAGGLYNPITDTWQPTNQGNAPSPRTYHRAVWTGSKMIVWGGWSSVIDGPSLRSGGLYDPVNNSWQPTAIVGAPQSRGLH